MKFIMMVKMIATVFFQMVKTMGLLCCWLTSLTLCQLLQGYFMLNSGQGAFNIPWYSW